MPSDSEYISVRFGIKTRIALTGRSIKHGKRALWSAPPSVFTTLANLATFIRE